MKDENKNREALKDLFNRLKWEEPSASFENSLMANIHRLAERRKRKQKLFYWASLTLSCLLLVIGAVFISWILNLDIVDRFKGLRLASFDGLGLYFTSVIGVVLLIGVHTYLRKKLYEES